MIKFTQIFKDLCTNFNKSAKSPIMQEKFLQLQRRFSHVDSSVLNKAIQLICDSEDFFPKNSTILRYIQLVKPGGHSENFSHCAKCGSTGRVSLILAIKWRTDSTGTRTSGRYVVHRELWEFNRWREIHQDPNMKKHYDDPNTYMSDQSAFCLCEKGLSLYRSFDSKGLILSKAEFGQA